MLLLFGYFWHPLRNGNGYNTWSGWLSDLGLLTIFTGLAIFVTAWYRKHNCHVHRCWRLQWHTHPEHGHPVCAVHHPSGHHGTWWRIFHRSPRSREHFLGADQHGYDHAHGQQQIGAASNAMRFDGTAPPFGVEVVVGETSAWHGDTEPEPPPKKERIRKPGTGDVTPIRKPDE